MKELTAAVVLARGLGTRMRQAGTGSLTLAQEAAAAAGAKVMMPLGEGRPFLDFALSRLAAAGFTEVCVVIGPEHEEIRRRYRDDAPPRRLRIAFAVQEEPRGTADAVLAAETFAHGRAIAVLNGDNAYPLEALAGLRSLTGPGLVGFSRRAMLERGNVEPARLASFAVVLAEGGKLTRFVEKPAPEFLAAHPDAPLSMNCWSLPPTIFAAARELDPSARGEYELPDAVLRTIEDCGEQYHVLPCDEPVLDLGHRQDVASVARALAGDPVSY